MRRLHEPVDPRPFVAWVDSLATDETPRAVLLRRAWPTKPDSASRRFLRWRDETRFVERAELEAAIEAISDDTTFSDLYGEDVARTASGRKKPSHAGIPITVPEDVLLEAHRLHLDEGYSLRKLARLFHSRTTAKSPQSLARILHNAFKQRGWDTLTRSEAVVAFNRAKVDHLPFCRHVHRIGAPKGTQCKRRTGDPSGYCWHHRPERLADIEQRLRPATQLAHNPDGV